MKKAPPVGGASEAGVTALEPAASGLTVVPGESLSTAESFPSGLAATERAVGWDRLTSPRVVGVRGSRYD